jgi:enamine deaminase RidA (YjgF/YER057c/UK114 family)
VALTSLDPAALPAPRGYSQIVVAGPGGRTVFVAGQVAVDSGGQLVAPGDLPAQARQAFRNLLAALDAAGAVIGDVAKITWYVVGYRPEMLPDLAAARAAVLGDHRPASTLIGVQALVHPDYLVEVEAIAIID